MSNVSSSFQKVQLEGVQTRGPVSESVLQTMSGSINAAVDRFAASTFQIFTSSGNFTVPANVFKLTVHGGGGGAGGGGGNSAGSGGGGGGAGRWDTHTFNVTPGDVLSVVCGNAGGGSSSNVDGTDGNASSIQEVSAGTIHYFAGGGGGRSQAHGGVGGQGGGQTANGSSNGGKGAPGHNDPSSGALVNSSSTVNCGGGGGADGAGGTAGNGAAGIVIVTW